MKTRTLRIGGMSCTGCRNKIEKKLKAAHGVAEASVSYEAGTATVTYEPAVISLDSIEDIITGLGYTAQSGDAVGAAEKDARSRGGAGALRAVGLLTVIVAAAVLVERFGVPVFSAFPTAEAGMGLGMMFVIGLITSVHCVAMCGGINLSQTLLPGGVAGAERPAEGGSGGRGAAGARGEASPRIPLIPSLFYNGGRVVSYTVIGGVVGAVGAAFSLSGRARGLVQLLAGVFMVVMGVNMLGIFPFLRRLAPRPPRFIADRVDRAKARAASPLVVGLLNGLMPCGPLQAMQLYALSTGSASKGAASMLLFSLGTVPLMFGLGALSAFLSSRPAITRRVMTAGACVVAVMGVTMFSQGAALSGLSPASLLPPGLETAAFGGGAGNAGGGGSAGGSASSAGGASVARVENGVQVVGSTLASGRYPAITVQAGIPVRWVIDAPPGSINGCNNRMVIPEYDIQYRFKPGENVIEFTPEKTGKFRYSCWMGMIRSAITVVPDSAALAAAAAGDAGAAPGPFASGADAPGADAPIPAGYVIPADELAVAEFADYRGLKIQRVSIRLTDEGFSPAVVVVQKGVPAEWIIDNRSLEDGSAELRVPLYAAALPLNKEAENPLYLQPEDDFDFSTGDSIFFGYVKVVDDLGAIDRESIKKEAAAFETLVYSDDYYAAAAAGCACCGGRGS